MTGTVQIRIKCVKCFSGHAYEHEPDSEPSFSCDKCGYEFSPKELQEQIKPQLLVAEEKEAKKAFQDLLDKPLG